MLTRIVARIVAACSRHALWVVLLAGLLTVLSAWFAATHFAINTDSNTLIASDLPWRQRQEAFNKAFPQNDGLILMVLDGATPEAAQDAADRIVGKLKDDTRNFDFVRLPPEQTFFGKDGLLFQPVAKVQQVADQLNKAQPLIATLADDPSLRGLSQMIGMMGIGIEQGKIPLAQVQPFFAHMADTVEGALGGKIVPFSFQGLAGGSDDQAYPDRRFVQIKPKLDYGALQPGAAATDVVHRALQALDIGPQTGVTVRLTGQIPLDDQEFGTLKEGFALNSVLTVLAVVFLLWLALKSGRLIVAVFLATAVGLVATAALGLLMVGALNLISVAFAVLFIGIGVDFGIQFSVRYRDERYIEDALVPAIVGAGVKAGRPLLLAAAATAAGFYSFLPTDYRGRVGTRPHRRFGHDHRLRGVDHAAARADPSFQPAVRGDGGGLRLPEARRRLPRDAPAAGDRRHARAGAPDVAAAVPRAVRLQSAEPEQRSGRVGGDRPRPRQGPEHDPLQDRRAGADARQGERRDRGRDRQASRGRQRQDARRLRAARSGADKLLDHLRPQGHCSGPSLDPATTCKPAPTDAGERGRAEGRRGEARQGGAEGQTGTLQATAKRCRRHRQAGRRPARRARPPTQAFVPAMHLLVDQIKGLISAETGDARHPPKARIHRDWVTADGQARIEVTPKDLSTSNANLKPSATPC